MYFQADVNAVGEALGSAVDVLNAVDLSVASLSPKAENMDMLLSQLAKTAAQERALLEECGDLLSVATSLEVLNTCIWFCTVSWQGNLKIGLKELVEWVVSNDPTWKLFEADVDIYKLDVMVVWSSR
jgi:hypothetical protein